MRQLSEKLEYRPTTTAAGKLIDENQLRRLYVMLMYDIEMPKQNMIFFIYLRIIRYTENGKNYVTKRFVSCEI